MHEDAAPFFRDVADHLARAAETVDSLDALLSTAFDAHLAQISVQQNDDMRKISAGAALIVVPTLIAGIYGMNFEHMPELGWTLGYPFALLLMVGGRRSGCGRCSRSPAGCSRAAQAASTPVASRTSVRARRGRPGRPRTA